jgi:WD repeat and SOF domain-containing protein 1
LFNSYINIHHIFFFFFYLVKLWNVQPDLDSNEPIRPVSTYLTSSTINALDTHYKDSIFVTAGVQVDLWEQHRLEPLHSFTWGCDSINTVKFNPIEHNILVSTASDRNIVLYDIRTRTPLRKMIMLMQTNTVSWNPMEAFHFSTGNEDTKAYTFDMRNLDHALTIHEDHVGAM